MTVAERRRDVTDTNMTMLIGMVADILLELRAIRAAGEQQPRRVSRLGRADLERLGQLLPAVAGAVGSEWFLCRDLVEHDSAALRLVLAGVTAKRLGRLLLRAEGMPIDGYVVEKGGTELNATLWRILVSAVSRSQKPPRADRDRV